MRQGKVLVSGVMAGILTEDETGYIFAYDPDYLSRKDALPVSLTLPLREKPYHNNVLFK